jgi:hypothetical protein
MIVVTEAEAAAIRAAFEQRGELSAAVTPAVPRCDRHRAGSRLCSDHRGLEAATRAAALGATGTPEETQSHPTSLSF